MEPLLLWIIMILVVGVAITVGCLIPVILRTKTLLLELLQSIVGKVEDREPFIYGAGEPSDEPPEHLAETVADAERQDLTNGTFRGGPVWEQEPPPSDETTP